MLVGHRKGSELSPLRDSATMATQVVEITTAGASGSAASSAPADTFSTAKRSWSISSSEAIGCAGPASAEVVSAGLLALLLS